MSRSYEQESSVMFFLNHGADNRYVSVMLSNKVLIDGQA